MNSDFTEKEYSFLRRAFIEKGEPQPTTEEEVKPRRLVGLPESLKDFEAFKKEDEKDE